jgi:hypothetical protein
LEGYQGSIVQDGSLTIMVLALPQNKSFVFVGTANEQVNQQIATELLAHLEDLPNL